MIPHMGTPFFRQVCRGSGELTRDVCGSYPDSPLFLRLLEGFEEILRTDSRPGGFRRYWTAPQSVRLIRPKTGPPSSYPQGGWGHALYVLCRCVALSFRLLPIVAPRLWPSHNGRAAGAFQTPVQALHHLR